MDYPARSGIADALQPGTRTLLTEVDIPNPDGTLTPGIYCTIELHIPRKTPSLLVSADAIIFNRDGLQVAVVEDGVTHIRKISVGRDLGTQVEVLDGIKQGDQVILNPPVDLVEGRWVQAVPRPPPRAPDWPYLAVARCCLCLAERRGHRGCSERMAVEALASFSCAIPGLDSR